MALQDASNPFAATPQGGVDFGFRGVNDGGPTNAQAPGTQPTQPDLGPWLTDDDQGVFKLANDLVLRQEVIAISRQMQDEYYRLVKLGYPFATLTRDPARNTYKLTLPAGTRPMSIAAVPNKAWDLCNKATELVMQDPPVADPSPISDDEAAIAAAAFANQFLSEDGSEQGTDDTALFTDAMDRALTASTTYLEYWVDPAGGGSIPLQILAHPAAQSPDNPLIGPDGMPTPDPVQRYITAPQGGQFTDDPSQAAPQWQPKIRASMWGREHWRVFPESQPVPTAQCAIGLLYCTVREARSRWPSIAQMTPGQIDTLTSWTPPRYLVLLPPWQRARWQMSNGTDAQKGAGDERLLFYYQIYQRSTPDNPQGADVVVSGASGGTIINKEPLSAMVEVPSEPTAPTAAPPAPPVPGSIPSPPAPIQQGTTGPKMQRKGFDLPVVQVTPRRDPDERDPTGRPYLELFAGATEFNAALATAFLEAVDVWLHLESYIPSTSPVSGAQVRQARVSGDAIPILRPEDKPSFGQAPPLPPNFWDGYGEVNNAIDSIASLNKPATGADDQQEVSGTARKVAVQQALVGLTRMQQPINTSFQRASRIKLELCQRKMTTEQQLAFVGDDGSWKVQKWTGADFAKVGSIGIQPGTGTMQNAEQKANYAATLVANGMISSEEASDAIRPLVSQRLGLPDDPHKQFIERCVSLWLQGPPSPQWAGLWQQYVQQKQAFHAQQALQARAALATPSVPGAPPPPPMGPPPTPPWTPFPARPNDAEPPVALLWAKRLSLVMSSPKYGSMIVEWQQALGEKYDAARQVVQAAVAPAPAPPSGQSGPPPSPSSPRPPAAPAPPQ